MEKILVYAYIKDDTGNEKLRQLIGWINFDPSYDNNHYSLYVENKLMSSAIENYKQLNGITSWIKETDIK
jgi:hypothetical protein